ncbi:uncharacterized protein [Anoplolepis gracilipes]|uniref:uncharacterized protein n=1 Tax=Anoplolepis gracilipes TaxID=354296 RepID=UPI003BA0B188
MELQEKSAFAQKNLVYDTIPLIIIDKMEKKHFKDDREILKYYYISSPFCMKFRLLLFWTLWFLLILAIMLCILTYFCFTPRMCHSSNRKHINE